jgi:hypothetical protein
LGSGPPAASGKRPLVIVDVEVVRAGLGVAQQCEAFAFHYGGHTSSARNDTARRGGFATASPFPGAMARDFEDERVVRRSRGLGKLTADAELDCSTHLRSFSCWRDILGNAARHRDHLACSKGPSGTWGPGHRPGPGSHCNRLRRPVPAQDRLGHVDGDSGPGSQKDPKRDGSFAGDPFGQDQADTDDRAEKESEKEPE